MAVFGNDDTVDWEEHTAAEIDDWQDRLYIVEGSVSSLACYTCLEHLEVHHAKGFGTPEEIVLALPKLKSLSLKFRIAIDEDDEDYLAHNSIAGRL
jgi:hypothetical protein